MKRGISNGNAPLKSPLRRRTLPQTSQGKVLRVLKGLQIASCHQSIKIIILVAESVSVSSW